jgi:hypothetical protein
VPLDEPHAMWSGDGRTEALNRRAASKKRFQSGGLRSQLDLTAQIIESANEPQDRLGAVAA